MKKYPPLTVDRIIDWIEGFSWGEKVKKEIAKRLYYEYRGTVKRPYSPDIDFIDWLDKDSK